MARRRRILAAGAIVASAALVCAAGCGSRDHSSAALPFSDSRWVALPDPPDADRSVLQAQLAIVGGRLYALVVPDSHGEGEALVWRYDDNGWAGPEGGAIPVDARDSVILAGGRRLCVAAARDRTPSVRCLSGTAWRAVGGAVYRRGANTGIDSFFAAGDRLYVVQRNVIDAHPEGPGVGGTPVETVYALGDDDVWRPTEGARFASAQRATGFALTGSRPCVAMNVFERPRRFVRVVCKTAGGWRPAARDLDGPARFPYDVDGVTTARGRLYIGVDQFGATNIDWPVHALVDGRWKHTSLSGSDPHWNEQGVLLARDGQVFALRFDQRTSRNGLVGRFGVTALDLDSGKAYGLGPPLVAPALLYSTVNTSLAATDETLYALYSTPNPATHHMEVKVSARSR